MQNYIWYIWGGLQGLGGAPRHIIVKIIGMKTFLQHDAMLAWYMPSSCVRVCLSVTLLAVLQVGWVKIGHFRQITHYNLKMLQDRRIVYIKVE